MAIASIIRARGGGKRRWGGMVDHGRGVEQVPVPFKIRGKGCRKRPPREVTKHMVI